MAITRRSIPSRRRLGTIALTSTVARAFSLLAILIVTVAIVSGSNIRNGLFQGEALRARLSTTLTDVVSRPIEIGAVKVQFGDGGFVSVSLTDVTVRGKGTAVIPVERVDLGLSVLPLLRGELAISTVRITGVDADIDKFASNTVTDWFNVLQSLNVRRSLASVSATFADMEMRLREGGIEVVSLADVRLGGLRRVGLRSDSLSLPIMRLQLDPRYTEGLAAEGVVRLGEELTRVSASWRSPTSEGPARTLRASLENVDLGQLPRMFASGETPFEIDAPLDVSVRVPFDGTGKPGRAFAWARVGSGHVWFADVAPTALHAAAIDLRLDPQRNSVALLPSRVRTSTVQATISGGIASTAAGSIDFEFATQSLRSKAGEQSRWHRGGASVTGRLEPHRKSLVFDDLRFAGEGGELRGSGSLDLAAWTPGVRFDVSTPRLEIETLKAFWPPFIASKVRRWIVSGAVEGGTLRAARLSTDIPTGAIAALKTGGTLGPAQLSLTLPIENASFRTVGDLPRMERAHGTAHIVGVSVAGKLAAGVAKLPDGRPVTLAGSRLVVPDFLVKDLPGELHLEASGDARDLLKLAATEPLSIAQSVGIVPETASGTARVEADVTTKMILRKRDRPADWSARIRVRDGALSKSFAGRTIAKANVLINATPELVSVDGVATLDGNRTRLAIAEPLGTGAGKSGGRMQAALRLDAAGRRRLGLDLGEQLRGPVDVRLRSGKNGWQFADVDLSAAVLDLSFVDWRKGKGIPGRARFRFRTTGGSTEIADLVVNGRGFRARGGLVVDARGLRSALLRNVALSDGAGISIDAARSKAGYRVQLRGDEYDARSVLGLVSATSPPSTAKASRKRIDLSARFGRVRGHGGEFADGVRADLTFRGTDIVAMDFKGTTRGRPLSVRMVERSKRVDLRILAENAGAALRFTDLYSKMRGGMLRARLRRDASDTYRGKISISDFELVREPKAEALLASGSQASTRRSKRIKVAEASADIRKEADRLVVKKGRLRGGDMAATFEGVVYDPRGRAKLKGTFLPAYGLNRMVSAIPFVGLAAGNGRKRGLLGITFRLDGPWRTPKLTVNPLSVFAPGVFRKIFE